MSGWLMVAAMAIAALSGVPGLFRPREGRAGEQIFVGLMTIAAALGLVAGLSSLLGGDAPELAAAWPVPGGRLAIQVDALSAMFVVPISLLAGLGAWYGLEYWPQRARPANGRKLRAFYGAVTAGMWLLVVSRNAILFLAGWEIMALSAFFLVSTEDEDAEVREVGLIYLITTRAGTLCLFAMFALLAAASGTLDLDGWPRALASPLGNAIFILGVCGFGLKAGIMPFHIWLPGAHARAPSHVSALMSGVLIKTGIYGIARLTALAAAPPLWWGYALIALGVVSGVLGVGFAIGQHDLKRLLAYHSVENIGIICLGLGVAVMGKSVGRLDLVALGVAGALLHVWNHGLFKGLLFLAAGSVLHATGTREIDRLGGLLGRMPATAAAFLVGAVAICGLPPLNGLISELLVFLGLFRAGSGAGSGGGPWLAGALAAPALALIGALALACFVKVYGAVFLGAPRGAVADRAHDPGRAMLAPMAILAAGCFAIGLGAPLLARVLDPAIASWAGRAAPSIAASAPLGKVACAGAALLAALALAGAWLAARARAAAAVGTWDCGYAAPSPRMQYTSSSFAAGLVGLLGWALRPRVHAAQVAGAFPARASFHSEVPDTVLDRVILPTFSLAGRLLALLRPIQRGSIHLYILYVLGTLFALLVWR